MTGPQEEPRGLGAAETHRLAKQLRVAASGTTIVLPTRARPMGGGEHV
ncbi:hypothetical protein RIF23_01490 [Lipingzhangella sp. LS1_29]|uniref:Uncharacterized protein n=1 Tax=Lipingzhangella rawalii TaxID=2055835 RepID=A0ABU2H0Z2_9ACTN|nr:hypothetical protein [Lipingzhangella rawalii]